MLVPRREREAEYGVVFSGTLDSEAEVVSRPKKFDLERRDSLLVLLVVATGWICSPTIGSVLSGFTGSERLYLEDVTVLSVFAGPERLYLEDVTVLTGL